MRKPQKLSTEKLKVALGELSGVDRCCLLVGSIIADHKHNPLNAVLGFAEVTARMASYLSITKRRVVAERLHGIAGRIELEGTGVFDEAAS